MEEIRRTVALRKEEGLEAAPAVVRTYQGKQAMDRVRQLIVEMADEEDRLLKQRTDWSWYANRVTAGTFSLATVMVIALLGLV